MKKALVFIALFLFMAVYAHAADYYFSTSGSNTTGDGSIGNPWHHFAGKKDGTNALSAGDRCLFKRGDVWTGSEAFIEVNSSGTANSPIIIGAYSTGNKPVFAEASVTSTSWSYTGANAIYTHSCSATDLNTVTQGDNKALSKWSAGAVTTLKEGTWMVSGSTLYVRCWGDVDPSSATIRFGNYLNNFYRGLVRSSVTDGTLGSYVQFNNLKVVGSNGVGMSGSSPGVKWVDCESLGSARDGVQFLHYTPTGESCDGCRWFGGEVSYNAASGGGNGQGMTTGSPRVWVTGVYSHDNFMAGMDFLDYDTTTDVVESGILWSRVQDNGRLKPNGYSYDPQIYVDGASEIFIYGNLVSGSGTTTDGVASKEGIKFGSEHPNTSSKICENISIINNKIYNNHWTGIGSDNASSSIANIKNINIAYNTVITYQAGTFDQALITDDVDTTSDNWKMRNNIFYGGATNGFIGGYMNSGAYLDADNNSYYRAGGATAIFSTNGGSTTYTLATWRTLSGEDASSVGTDPLLTTVSDSSPNFYLQDGSPALDSGYVGAYTVPSWLPQTIKNYLGTPGIRGTTRASGVIDDYASAPDMGFHYDYADLLSTNVEPASLVASAVGNVTVSFTIPDPMAWIPANGKIKVTMPAGYTINSGGSTAVSSMSLTGTATVGVAGQVITITRVGDGLGEVPGDFTITLSNIANSASTGATGVYGLTVTDASDNILAGDAAVASDTILAGGGGVTAGHFSCGPGITGKGFTLT